jgi:hypothetical protein
MRIRIFGAKPVRIRILDSSVDDPGSGAFLNSGAGMRIQDPRWGKNPDPVCKSHIIFIFSALETVFLVIYYLSSLMRIVIRNLFGPGSGMKNSDPG